MHKLCIMNRLKFEPIPPEILRLTEVSKKCLSLRSPLMKLGYTPIDSHRKLLKG